MRGTNCTFGRGQPGQPPTAVGNSPWYKGGSGSGPGSSTQNPYTINRVALSTNIEKRMEHNRKALEKNGGKLPRVTPETKNKSAAARTTSSASEKKVSNFPSIFSTSKPAKLETECVQDQRHVLLDELAKKKQKKNEAAAKVVEKGKERVVHKNKKDAQREVKAAVKDAQKQVKAAVNESHKAPKPSPASPKPKPPTAQKILPEPPKPKPTTAQKPPTAPPKPKPATSQKPPNAPSKIKLATTQKPAKEALKPSKKPRK
ncbi:hypothetical protein EK21DRAFT_107735 [Setomelanomma holmii]|uniref:Uncharacterized protein n=1 Tax=Setomelanomma holmii TaxID=210430 RepID=A0A9P4LTB8_9PLEO|nr:hypothetical protein EK21DRAFT_107735 [Setomelanomma holmii]